MKSSIFVSIVMGLILCLSLSIHAATYGGGGGTAADPYLIYTPEQMNDIGVNPADWDKCFKLMANIDMAVYTGTQYNIIGGNVKPFHFTGTFAGDGHTIRNLTYTTSEKVHFVALFGSIWGATIENLRLENVTLSTAGSWVGGLAGQTYHGSTIINCHTSGFVNGDSRVGGLVGFNGGDITSCNTACQVRGESEIGGLVGSSGEGAITSCYATGAVSGIEYVGGLVGGNDVGTITSCYATGVVSMIDNDEDLNGAIGGLVGYNNGALVNCYATGSVNENEDVWCNNTGGLAGYNKHIITSCHATGAVAGNDSVGGLAGYNVGAIAACYASGSVSGDWAVGGLAGKNDGDITSSHATSSVEGRGQIGGLVGVNNSSIASCYAAGAVESFEYGSVGGLVGQNSGMVSAAYATGPVTGLSQYAGGLVGEDYYGSVIGSFWDTQTSGQTSSGGGTSKTTAELQTLSTFLQADWDFYTTEDPADWFMPPASYPRLAWENAAPACGDAAHPYPKMDFTQDCRVDLADFAIFAASWLECSAMECD